jgi:RNA polymerase sigma factor (sigma-70 family)
LQTTGGGEGSSTAVQRDGELLALIHRDPAAAWQPFLERYAGFILAELGRLGFAREPALDGFVYVCEKLAEDGFRRLRAVRHLGRGGELVPWLRTVVRNLASNWIDARDGRKRLLKSVAALPAHCQRVFQLYFWRGLKPSEVLEVLRRGDAQASTATVYDCLEALFSRLSENRIWHLVSGLARSRGALSLDAPAGEGERVFEPAAADPDPESALLQRESADRLHRALARLPARERLLLQLRYEDALPVAEIGEVMGMGARECERRLAEARGALRAELVELADGPPEPTVRRASRLRIAP